MEPFSEKKSFQLTKQMVMSDIGLASPKAAALLAEYGLHCLSCFANQFDTIEQGALLHGFSEEETEQMLVDINEELKRNTKTI